MMLLGYLRVTLQPSALWVHLKAAKAAFCKLIPLKSNGRKRESPCQC